MIRIEPEKQGSPIRIILFFILFPILGYFYEGYARGDWYQAHYALSFIVPAVVIPLVLRYLFVSGPIEYTEDYFKIVTRLRGEVTYPWSDLKYYGDGNGDFLIQFGEEPAIQIFFSSYVNEDWQMLVNFLTAHFPERKADGFVGTRLFKWNK
jgi:hypothetical protein